MPNASDYTIGWICAVQKESVAAEVFLDEEYDELDSLPVHDNNAYTLGRIGKHNVVIAVLPLGIYGLVKASNALKDMIRSFPNLRLGLMVGIGGGAPAKNDIRLGDVVVSVAGDGQGGVLQYDYGKAVQSEAFRITAHLNKPPDFVMTAVSKLATTYVKKGHRIQEAIESALNEYPRLRADYQKPPTDMDRLHRPDALHDETCVHSCGDDPSKLVSRRTRSATEDDPVIHYGLIASANSLMKDASIRDRFSTDYNVLCFDMEAAGLMDQLPFLVVRGICDYSDTHKKKQWQGYAAMTAAAYTKDLLSKIAPNQVEAEKKLSDILSDVSGAVSSIKEVVTNTQSRLEKEEYRKILEWLVPIDYGTQQTDYLRRRQPGTGQWLLESAEYRTWVEQPSKTLFCPGIAGAGKTILSSIVVDDLENRFRTDTDATTIYIYCNYKRQSEQTIEHFLSSLVKQLAQCQTSLPDHLKDLYAQHEAKRTRPSLKQLSEALDTVASKYSRLFIIIDALDECQDTDGCRAKLLSAIFDLQKKTRANVFATSRFIPDVTERFAEATIIEIRATESDIRRYLEGHISELPRLVATQPDLQDEIMTSITMAVEGMYVNLKRYVTGCADFLSFSLLGFYLRSYILLH
ncbi:ankyrin repeat protein [Xylariaceae sp. FL0255]|nr:ankyrin repeat protein [Xylariaceae sp. FL0255]